MSEQPTDHVRTWLASLPAEERAEEPGQVLLEGALLASPPGVVRLVVEAWALDLVADDVLGAEELAGGTGDPGYAIPSRLTLRRGFRVLEMQPSSVFGKLLTHRLPFALAVRPEVIPLQPSQEYVALEDSFFESRGIQRRPAGT